MKKTHWPARLAAGCLVTLDPWWALPLLQASRGSQSNPLVTLKLSDQKATHPFCPRWTESSRPGRRRS